MKIYIKYLAESKSVYMVRDATKLQPFSIETFVDDHLTKCLIIDQILMVRWPTTKVSTTKAIISYPEFSTPTKHKDLWIWILTKLNSYSLMLYISLWHILYYKNILFLTHWLSCTPMYLYHNNNTLHV